MTFGATSQIVSTINEFIYRLTLRFYLFPCLSTGIPIHFNGTLSLDFYYSVVVVAVRLATWQILLSLHRCRSIPEWRVAMLLQGNRSRNRGFPWCSCAFFPLLFNRYCFLLVDLLSCQSRDRMMTIVCTSRSAVVAQKRNLRKPRSVLNSSRVDSKSFLLSASSFSASSNTAADCA